MAVQTMPAQTGRRVRSPLSDADAARRNRLIVGVLLVAALVYPFVVGLIPQGAPAPTVNNLIVMCYYAVLALGLNIVVGFAGLLDLGYVAFYVFGAYTTAFLASPQFGLHAWWPLVAMVAIMVAAGAGLLLGAPTLRLRGDYLAIVTLGFGEIVPELVRNLDKVNVTVAGIIIVGPDANITGGALGINPVDALVIPLPAFLQTLFKVNELSFSNSNPNAAFYLVLGILLLSFFVCRRLRDSRLGRAWMAIREDETAAGSMGINTTATKLLAFALGASFSGFVGAFVGLLPDRGLPRVVQLLGLDQHPDHGHPRRDGQPPRRGRRRLRPDLRQPDVPALPGQDHRSDHPGVGPDRVHPRLAQLPDLRDRPGPDDDLPTGRPPAGGGPQGRAPRRGDQCRRDVRHDRQPGRGGHDLRGGVRRARDRRLDRRRGGGRASDASLGPPTDDPPASPDADGGGGAA